MKRITISSIFALVLEILLAYYIYTFSEIFNLFSIILIIISIVIMIIGIVLNDEKMQIFSYSIALITVIFVRNTTDNNITSISYIKDWLKILFTNKIVFINVWGNIVIYMPLYLLITNGIHKLRKLLTIVILFIIIVSSEFIQYILKVGVFDIIDIILNTIGLLVISFLNEVFRWKRNQRKQEKNYLTNN